MMHNLPGPRKMPVLVKCGRCRLETDVVTPTDYEHSKQVLVPIRDANRDPITVAYNGMEVFIAHSVWQREQVRRSICDNCLKEFY